MQPVNISARLHRSSSTHSSSLNGSTLFYPIYDKMPPLSPSGSQSHNGTLQNALAYVPVFNVRVPRRFC